MEQEAKPTAKKDDGRKELARRYNSMMGGTGKLPDAEKNSIKSDLLQKLQVPPEQMTGTGGTYDPRYLPAQKAGALPKVEFHTYKGTRYTLTVGGGHTGINSKSLAGAIEYLQGAISEDPEAQANAEGPAMEPDVQTEDDGTVFDGNTGQEIDQTADYVPYEAAPGELEKAADTMDGVLEGVNAQGLFDLLTLPPNNANINLMKFKRSLRGGETPWLAPEVQKEVFDAHVSLIGIAKKIKEGKYIDNKDLTPKERRLLDAFSCRGKSNKGAWFGRQKAMDAVRELAPNYAAYLADMNGSVYRDQDTYGVSLGAYTQEICDQFKGIDVRKETGESTRALFNSSEGDSGSQIFQTLGTKKEHLFVGMLNTFFGTETLDTSVKAMEDFAQTMQDVCDLGEVISDYVPTNGNLAVTLENEDARVAAEEIMSRVESDNCHDAALDYIKDTIRESYMFARVAKDAGVVPTAVVHQGEASTSSEKADLVVEFASPEDAQKFADALSNLGAGEVTIAPTESGQVGISLKSQSSFNKDTPSGGAYYNAAYAYDGADCASLSTAQQKKDCQRAQEFAPVKKSFLTPSENKSAEEAAKVDAVISRAAGILFGSDTRARSSVRHVYKTIFGDVSDGDVKTLRMISEWQEEIDSALNSNQDNPSNRERVYTAQMNFIRRMRKLKAEQSPEVDRGMAINDLCSSFLTVEDDVMMKAMRGEIRFMGNHQAVKHVLKKAKPVRTRGGGYSWVVDGKVVFSTDLRAKSSRKGAKKYPKMEAKVRAALFDLLGTAVSESSRSGEEELHRKLNELIEAIHVAVAK